MVREDREGASGALVLLPNRVELVWKVSARATEEEARWELTSAVALAEITRWMSRV